MAKKHRRRRRSWSRTLLLLVFTAAALYAGAHCLFRAPDLSPEAEVPVSSDKPGSADLLTDEKEDAEALAQKAHTERKPYFYTILLSGSDDGNGNSDTNILLAVDGENSVIHGVSIPRDTKANFHGKNQKINAAFGAGGSELLAEVVSDQLGIPVDFTVSVDLKGFQALVEAIGGVDFYVPVDMDYDDPIQDLRIHFAKGTQHLNGADAMKVVRFRHNNDGTGYGSEDIGRMETQQAFLKAVAKKALANPGKINEYVKIFQKYVDTNLSLSDMAWFGQQALSAGLENISFSTLPGEWHSPYIYLDQAETLALVNAHLNPYVEDRTAEDLHILSR